MKYCARQMKIALPKGRLLQDSDAWLRRSGIELRDYSEKSRSYRPKCSRFPDLQVKVFHEKDIPVQVAVGNYDLGVCGLDWVEELLAKYPSSALVKLWDLGYGEGELCAATSRQSGLSSVEDIQTSINVVRMATEYPNLAESFALNLRLRQFKIFALWGSAEIHPPENADVVLTCQFPSDSIAEYDLVAVATVLQSSAYLIANRKSWESKDISGLLEVLCCASGVNRRQATVCSSKTGVMSPQQVDFTSVKFPCHRQPDSVVLTPQEQLDSSKLRLALPDGHQRKPTIEFLDRAGIDTSEYAAQSRRPILGLDGVVAKVIRPQDMPLQVANDNFDLAVTGRDWLRDHLSRFPTSPVRELLDLGFGKVKIVAAMKRDMGFRNVSDLRAGLRRGDITCLRIASEYTNIADKYALDNHLSPYRLIPTWGASEAFLPEDADLLIENTETGRTLAEHDLEIIDVLFESSACLAGGTSGDNGWGVECIIEIMKRGL